MAIKNVNSWIAEPQSSYIANCWNGELDLLVGSTLQQRYDKGQMVRATGYSDDLFLDNIQSATNIFPVYSMNSVYKYAALFGRLNYKIKNKYIINLSSRRDGSSRFGTINQYKNFSAVGLGWIFSEEQLIKKNLQWFSFGKLRASYGTTGSDQIGDYSFLGLYANVSADVPYQGSIGLRPNSISNPYLTWEETKKIQLGLDLGFLKRTIVIERYLCP